MDLTFTYQNTSRERMYYGGDGRAELVIGADQFLELGSPSELTVTVAASGESEPVELPPGPPPDSPIDISEPPPEPPGELPPPEGSDYNAMTVSELSELCSERGLPVSGTKAELVARLEEDDASA